MTLKALKIKINTVDARKNPFLTAYELDKALIFSDILQMPRIRIITPDELSPVVSISFEKKKMFRFFQVDAICNDHSSLAKKSLWF